jgi:hypothetical protein
MDLIKSSQVKIKQSFQNKRSEPRESSVSAFSRHPTKRQSDGNEMFTESEMSRTLREKPHMMIIQVSPAIINLQLKGRSRSTMAERSSIIQQAHKPRNTILLTET